MARIARVVVPGAPHYVAQHGNRGMKTFFGDEDYEAYLSLLSEWCGLHGVAIRAYCLMPNNVHLILVPPSYDALCRAVGETHRRYTCRVNSRKGWRGHLWEGRFSSFVMADSYLPATARYVERNPVKARRAAHAEDWPWSSAAGHVDRRRKSVAETDWLAKLTAGWECNWREYLAIADDAAVAKAILLHEHTGRPLGDAAFVKKVESLLGRVLAPRKPGPKPKKKAKRKAKRAVTNLPAGR